MSCVPTPSGVDIVVAFVAIAGALRRGPPFHGSRSAREIKIQNASCQMGGR